MPPLLSAVGEARPFWLELERFSARTALIDGREQRKISYDELASHSAIRGRGLADASRSLVVIEATLDADCVAWLLGSLQAGHAVCLVKPQMSSQALDRFVERFAPSRLLLRDLPAPCGYAEDGRAFALGPRRVLRATTFAPAVVDPDLALLLLTSGSVGPPKAVKLSRRNLTVSAFQVASALDVTPDDRTLLSLPLSYVYGLSVLTSHLLVGASVLLDNRSILDPSCVASWRAHELTTLPGVSFTFEAMSKIGWDRLALPSVRKLTHSGDTLKGKALSWAVAGADRRDFEFYRMYGMTEASGRIAVLSPSQFTQNPHSVGAAVPGGELRISREGEVLFAGPNVMMGYASDRSDLERSGYQNQLRTGDLGHLDASGRLTLTGRISRIAKVLGVRVGLDEIEESLGPVGLVAALHRDDVIYLFGEPGSGSNIGMRLPTLAAAFGLHPRAFRIVVLEFIPRQESGKLAREDFWSQVR